MNGKVKVRKRIRKKKVEKVRVKRVRRRSKM